MLGLVGVVVVVVVVGGEAEVVEWAMDLVVVAWFALLWHYLKVRVLTHKG